MLPVDPAMGDPTAHALHEALSRRDWRIARDVLLTITDPDHHALCLNAAARVQGVQEWIGEWVEAEPRSDIFCGGGGAASRMTTVPSADSRW